MTRLRAAEVFRSIQGEGGLVGVPSWFIRLSGCPLRCRWCDTPYASWSPEGPHREVGELVEEAAGSGVRHVVVTGGEPLAMAGVVELVDGLMERRLHVTVETAGAWDPEGLHCDLLSVSPKLSGSDPPGAARALHQARRARTREVLPRLLLGLRAPSWQVKFVCAAAEDVLEAEEFWRSVGAPSGGRVYLMPEGRTAEEVLAHARVLAPLALELGWALTPRYHVELWGNRRGV